MTLTIKNAIELLERDYGLTTTYGILAHAISRKEIKAVKKNVLIKVKNEKNYISKTWVLDYDSLKIFIYDKYNICMVAEVVR